MLTDNGGATYTTKSKGRGGARGREELTAGIDRKLTKMSSLTAPLNKYIVDIL